MNVSSGAFSALTGWQFTGGDMDRSIFYLTKEAWMKIANPSVASNGWQGSGNNWYYYENGSAIKNDWRKVDGKWYHFDGSGKAQVGWQQINGHWYYFNINHDGTFGAALTGWQEINGKKYYFDPDNAWMLTGKQEIDGKSYNFGDDGSLQAPIDNQPNDPQPTKPVPEVKPVKDDNKVIDDDLKSYIQEQIKESISKLKIVSKD